MPIVPFPQQSNAVRQADRLALELPWPPSANTYWRFPKGSASPLVSSEGRVYRNTVAAMCLYARTPSYAPGVRLAVSVSAYPPDRRRRDLDNLLKATLDALEWAKVYQDDSQIDALAIQRMGTYPNGLLAVHIETLLGGE